MLIFCYDILTRDTFLMGVHCTSAGSSLCAQNQSACPARCAWCQIGEVSPTSWTLGQVGVITWLIEQCIQVAVTQLWLLL